LVLVVISRCKSSWHAPKGYFFGEFEITDESARLMLENTRHPIETIARHTGFADRDPPHGGGFSLDAENRAPMSDDLGLSLGIDEGCTVDDARLHRHAPSPLFPQPRIRKPSFQ
jgi:hypothetical protein